MRENYLTIIPVAGKGIRALCLTGYGATLKPFVNAAERGATILEEIVREATDSGLFEFAMVVSGKEDQKVFKRFFRPFEADPGLEDNLRSRGRHDDLMTIKKLSSLDVVFFEQTAPRGFGDAIAQAYPKIVYNRDNGRTYDGIVVILGDDVIYSKSPCCKQLISAHRQTGCMIVGVQAVGYEEAKKFGVILIDSAKGKLGFSGDFYGKAAFEVVGIEEKPKDPLPNLVDGERRYFAILGRYVLNEDDVGFLAGQYGTPKAELDFTSLFRKNIDKRRLIAVEVEGDWHTVGSSLAAQKAAIKYGLSQYKRGGEVGEEGKELCLYTLKIMKEDGVIVEISPCVFRLADELGVMQ